MGNTSQKQANKITIKISDGEKVTNKIKLERVPNEKVNELE